MVAGSRRLAIALAVSILVFVSDGASREGLARSPNMTRILEIDYEIGRISRSLDHHIAELRGLETGKPGSPSPLPGSRGRPYRDRIEVWEARLRNFTERLSKHREALNEIRTEFGRIRSDRLTSGEVDALTATLRAVRSERNRLQRAIAVLNGLFRDLSAMKRAHPG